MVLKYFSLSDDRDILKKKYKALAIKHHPDKNIHNQDESTRIMQEINSELDYCIKCKNGGLYSSSGDIANDMMIFMNEIMNEVRASRSFRKHTGLASFIELSMDAINDFASRKPPVVNLQQAVKEYMTSFINAQKKRNETNLKKRKTKT